jgi:alkylation response protein AidB-like acyl-CoA dehydrogenase
MPVSGVINTHFIVAYMLMQHGTEEQKQKYLPRMVTGEVRGAFSMSEPGCGSDVSAITSKAVRDGDGWKLNGQKMWLTNGGSSTLVAVLVRTDGDVAADASVYKKMSTFLIEKPSGFGEVRPGLTIPGKIESFAPATGSEFAMIPVENAVGNFTKIAQRLPVRIAVDPKSPLAGALRPGLSVSVEVDVSVTTGTGFADAGPGPALARSEP